jgi:hypothetical protein
MVSYISLFKRKKKINEAFFSSMQWIHLIVCNIFKNSQINSNNKGFCCL